MAQPKSSLLGLSLFCLTLTGISVAIIKGLEPEELQSWLATMGWTAPLIYIGLYTIATLLILPSSPLNITGGALFGLGWGTFWTTLAAIVSAVAAFWFARTIGRSIVERKLDGRWLALDRELRQGGVFYIFAIRLLPLLPYGIVNFVSGLTSIKFKDYLVGTMWGTVPGVLPFVMMGSGMMSLSQGNIFPLMLACSLTGISVGVGTWYRRRRQDPTQALKAKQKRRE